MGTFKAVSKSEIENAQLKLTLQLVRVKPYPACRAARFFSVGTLSLTPSWNSSIVYNFKDYSYSLLG